MLLPLAKQNRSHLESGSGAIFVQRENDPAMSNTSNLGKLHDTK